MTTYKKHLVIAIGIWTAVNIIGDRWISYYGRHVYRQDIFITLSPASMLTYLFILNRRAEHGAN